MNQKLNPRRLLVVVMFVLSAPGCSAANAGESVQLVVDSRPRATILLAENHFKQAAKKATQNPTSKAHESSRNDSKT